MATNDAPSAEERLQAARSLLNAELLDDIRVLCDYADYVIQDVALRVEAWLDAT